MDDKLIEVVGMYSSLHIGTIQVSLAEPLRIGQASEVKVCVCEHACLYLCGVIHILHYTVNICNEPIRN